MYNFRGKEENRKLPELVDIFEQQIINGGSPEYIQALSELIKSKYQREGLTDFDANTDGEYEARNLELEYFRLEEKLEQMVICFDKGEAWKPNIKAVKAYRN